MKKRIAALFMATIMAAGMLAGCGGNSPNASANEKGGSDNGINWPGRTVEVVVTASAGGDTDFNARTFATYFEKYTGQSMVITNTPGGGGSVATSQVKNAKPDGNKILFCHTGQLIVNEVAGLIDYNMDAFNVACIPAVDRGTVLVASKSSGITSVEDMIEKASSGTVTYASELGGYSHLQGLILMDLADIELKVLDIGSTSDKITNLLGARVDLAAISYGAVKDYAETGELVILAQYNEERNENLGDIPTFKESGLDFVMEKPYIISFPKGTDPAIVEKMNEVARQIAEDPDYQKDLVAGYNQPAEYIEREAALLLLDSLREDYMQYQSLLIK